MASDRTEKATPKRREEAQKQGQVARRPDLAAVASFLAALLMLRISGGALMERGANLFRQVSTTISNNEMTALSVHGMFLDAGGNLGLMVLPLVGATLVASLAVNFAQGGLTLAPKAFTPRAERFNPISNLKRVFGPNGLVELLKGVLKLGGIGLAGWGIFGRAVADAPSLIGIPATKAFVSLGTLIYDLGLRAGGVLFLAAVLDYGYGWFKHERSLRMTKQELKDEFRKQEGDPLVKGMRRRAARMISQRRMAAEVPRADVIVTNPTHFSVALRYDREKDAAPRVVAKGADLMAKAIREIAKKHGVPLVENPPLARALYKQVDVGKLIPADLFRAVAELLAYVYRQSTDSINRSV
ncbi:MAG TPA: EscU/YscU/HrcU family type III secretion system export apparatus switch protein [Pyrinomonadaceae bacterium]|nr:EscU/YscU/HrcU family type III secretion system export apparatus switch protein [Pyrinomonadaceae bacterium]